MKKLYLLGAVCVLSLSISVPSHAAPTFYTDATAFEADASTAGIMLSTETFADITPIDPNVNQGTTFSPTPNITVSQAGTAYIGVNRFELGGLGIDWGRSDEGAITLTFEPPTNVFSVGVGDLGTAGPTTFTLSVNGVSKRLFIDFRGGADNRLFAGVIDKVTPFTSITFSNIGAVLTYDYVALTNVQTGDHPPVIDPVIDDSATIADDAVIGDGSTVGAAAVIERGVVIGEGSSIGPNVKINKDVTLGDNAVIGEGSAIYKDVTAGDDLTVGTNVVIYKDVMIGRNVTIGDNSQIHMGTVIGNDAHIGMLGGGVGVFVGNRVIIPDSLVIGDGEVIPNDTTVQ